MNVRLSRLRRPLAALFAAAAAGLALLALRPAPPPSVRVLAAARDLPAGKALIPSDLRPVSLPPGSVPSGALHSPAAGRVLAGPMRRGEPLTDARVVGAALLRGYGPGTVAAPVRVADADAARLLRPGDRIDVLTTPARPDPLEGPHQQGPARIVVSAVPVVAIPPPSEGRAEEGALVVLATDRAQAAALAGTGAPLSLTIANP
ncbi:Flp pilus assembly protein CpaB [Actinomadura soli]|uniref:Flp pilus assembly protein CpaB n=1 Tax=Actinomadura soli TaxID=2508997 RepID=A0A5C4JCU7_9ACTN|nr:Flp pilus assembly protein CpaB [Actinomadura soli]TMR01853.1 Flp pilus assembly protein CpaB [Actinomadura soli]